MHGNAVFFQGVLEHGGKGRIHDAREQLVGELHDGGLHAPQVGKGLGHLDADKTAADHHRPAHLAAGQPFLDRNRLVQVADGEYPRQIGARNRQDPRLAASGEHQLVVGEFFSLARIQVLHLHRFGPPVDGQGPGARPHGHPLCPVEKGGVPGGVETGLAELHLVVHVAGHIIRNAATAVGDEAVLIDDRDVEFRAEAFQAAGGLGTGGNAADDEDLLTHGSALLQSSGLS